MKSSLPKALVDEAHMLGLKAAVHAHGTAGIKDAIRAGVDTIEHASLADDEAFALAKQHGTWFSMDVYDGFNARQFATMVKWGMTPIQAIQAATVNAAEALGRAGDVGAIAVGRYGDLIGVAGDPLADVTRLQSVAFVMKGGEIIKAPRE